MQVDPTEEWRPVVGYEGWYSVSSFGRVRREQSRTNGHAGHMLSDGPTSRRYAHVSLYLNGQVRTHTVHKLVAAAFFSPRPDRWQVNHINGIKRDNRAENLEYVSARRNSWHAAETGLREQRVDRSLRPPAYASYRLPAPSQSPKIERWRPVVGYEGWYSVSSLGRVRREPRQGSDKRSATPGRLLSLSPINGYYYVRLTSGGRHTGRSIAAHRLVAAAFLGPCPHGRSVNHKDGHGQNNRVENLEYATQKQQIHHAWAIGLARARHGSAHHAAKLTEADVLAIRRRYAADTDASPAALAAEFGITYRNLWSIVARKTWRHC